MYAHLLRTMRATGILAEDVGRTRHHWTAFVSSCSKAVRFDEAISTGWPHTTITQQTPSASYREITLVP
jgi:hypothetical protein